MILLTAAGTACGGGDTAHRPPAFSTTFPTNPGSSVAPGSGPTPLTALGRSIFTLCVVTGAATTLPASVPDVVGSSLQGAAQMLGCHGFRFTVVPRGAAPSDVVVSQSPAPGSPTSSGQSVTLTVRRRRYA